jgi:hypothetical protein
MSERFKKVFYFLFIGAETNLHEKRKHPVKEQKIVSKSKEETFKVRNGHLIGCKLNIIITHAH